MALQSRVGTYIFEHDGQSIKLSSSGENIRRLEESTGIQLDEFFDLCTTPKKMAELFHYMQGPSGDSDGNETIEAIYDAFFYDTLLFVDPEFQVKVQEAISALIGREMLRLFKESKEASKKK